MQFGTKAPPRMCEVWIQSPTSSLHPPQRIVNSGEWVRWSEKLRRGLGKAECIPLSTLRSSAPKGRYSKLQLAQGRGFSPAHSRMLFLEQEQSLCCGSCFCPHSNLKSHTLTRAYLYPHPPLPAPTFVLQSLKTRLYVSSVLKNDVWLLAWWHTHISWHCLD